MDEYFYTTTKSGKTSRDKTKNPTKPNKQKVGFMKKHKKSKAESNPAFDRMNKADQNAAKATRKRKK